MVTKNYLIDKIHNELNYLSKEDVKDSVNLILDYLSQSLKEQERIEIRNFGNFSIRKRKFPESRVLSKFAYREEFGGDTERSTAAYKKVCEDASIGSTYKLPLEVEFGKNSVEKFYNTIYYRMPKNLFKE
ncbi:MAG: Integration host factor subunit beta [Pseudomonadota bacterium]|jgi:RPE1 domain-containing protein